LPIADFSLHAFTGWTARFTGLAALVASVRSWPTLVFEPNRGTMGNLLINPGSPIVWRTVEWLEESVGDKRRGYRKIPLFFVKVPRPRLQAFAQLTALLHFAT